MSVENECPAISKGEYIQYHKYDHPIFNDELNEDYLYHFTSIKSLIAITKNLSLRASPFEKMNDPMESYKSNRHTISGRYHQEPDQVLRKQLLESAKLGEEVADSVRRKAHVLCFCEDGVEECGIIRKGYAVPQMWSHYGSSQKGVCIIISKKKLLKAVEKQFPTFFHQSVIYDTAHASGATIKINPEKILELGEEEFRKNCMKASPDLFWFYKDDGWMYEQEYRIVIPEPKDEYSFVAIAEATVGICLGAKFPSQSWPHVNKFKEAFCIMDEKSPKIQWDKGIGYPTGIARKT